MGSDHSGKVAKKLSIQSAMTEKSGLEGTVLRTFRWEILL